MDNDATQKTFVTIFIVILKKSKTAKNFYKLKKNSFYIILFLKFKEKSNRKRLSISCFTFLHRFLSCFIILVRF